MFRDKTYNGNLNIGTNNVSLDTDLPFKMIVIKYFGVMRIASLMSDSYTIKNNTLSKEIVISNINESDNIINDLFKYKGRAGIYKCILHTYNNIKYNIYVNKSNLEVWNSLRKTEKVGTTDGVAQDWASLTRNWEDISFDGNNDKKPYMHRRTTYDNETKTYTTIKELRKK